MAAVTVQDLVGKAGAVVAFAAAAAGGDTVTTTSFESGGWDMRQGAVIVINGGATAIDVTVGGGAAVNIPAGGRGVFPLRTGYADEAIAITYTAVTSVVVAAVRFRAQALD